MTDDRISPKEVEKGQDTVVDAVDDVVSTGYRLYRRRFSGLIGLFLLNVVGGMSWPYFGPIANDMSAEFGFTLDQVNWLGIIVACIYLPVSLLVPPFISKYGIRRCCDIGAICLILAAWIRYAGTIRSLPVNGSYALIIIGQLFASISQPIYQVLGPKFSETWFDLRGRTTATMFASIANPIGGALGQLLSPIVGDTRQAILVLAIICTAATPFVLLVEAAPPTPPTYAAATKSPSIWSLLKVLFGLDKSQSHMTARERFDFAIVIFVFGILSAATNTFSILTGQIFEPAGYSSDMSGFFGACLLLSGIVAAVATAPLFDRVFTHHLSVTTKILVPILSCTWLSLIWAVRPHNVAALYALMALLGITSVTMLPVALELACDLTRNADGSSSILWFACNLFAIVFILSEGALRAGPDGNPPLSMRRALIFNGAFIMAAGSLVFLLRGKQVRKELDEEKQREAAVTPQTE